MKKWGIAGEEVHGNLEDLIEVDFTLTHINIHMDLIRKKKKKKHHPVFSLLHDAVCQSL